MSFCISLKCQLSVSLLASGSQMLSLLSQNMQDELKHYPPTDSKCTEGNMLLTATLCLFVVVMLHGYILFTFGLVDFPVGTWCSYTSSEKRTDPRASFPFSLPCCVFFFFFFLFWLTQGWSKGAYLINPFQTGRLCKSITGQNYYEQLKLEILFDTEKCI